MAWAAVAQTGLSIAGGLFGGGGEKRAAREQREQEAAFRQRELDQADAQFDWTKQIYGEHKEKFDPLFDEMRGMMDDVQPDYGAIAGDINSSFDSAQGMEERQQRRYGIKPTDGAARQSQRQYGIKRGAAHVGARSAARAGAKQQKYARRADLYNSGQGIGSNNAAMVQNSMTNQQNASRGAANAAGSNARMHDQNSMADAAGWGQLAGGLDWGGIFNSVKGWGSGSSGGSGRGA